MINFAQKRSSISKRCHGINLPRTLLEYLGKIAISDEDIKQGPNHVKNRIRGRIAYK